MVVKFLFHSHVLLSCFFCASNVCSDHVVIDSTTKSRLDEWSRKHVHTHTHTMTTLLEMGVYDRLPANSTYSTSTKKEKGIGRTDERRRKVLAIVRMLANMGMSDTIPIFQSILLIPILSFSFFFNVSTYVIDHRTIELWNNIYIYTANCRFFSVIQVYRRALVRSR